MSATFDPSLPSDRDLVRLLIGDVDPSAAQVADETIDTLLDARSNVYCVAADLLGFRGVFALVVVPLLLLPLLAVGGVEAQDFDDYRRAGAEFLSHESVDHGAHEYVRAGISTNLDRWAFRPEVGLVVNPGEDGTTWGWTLGISLRP